MTNPLKTTSRTLRFAAVALGLTVGVGACADAESREAPDYDTPATDSVRSTDPGATVDTRPDRRPAPAPVTRTDSVAQRTVPAETSMTFYVDDAVSTETHAVGDRFTATLQMPVHDMNGDIALETGTESRWVVTESTTENGEALLAVELESINVNGNWAPIRATVEELELDADNPDSNSETAAKIGVGTAAGALIGQILGKDTESTLKGAGVGAAVGAAVALATRGGSATIPAGSALKVSLNDRLVVS